MQSKQFIALIPLLLCVCATIGYDTTPDPGKAYLYGRFEMSQRYNATVKLVLSRQDKKYQGLVIPLDDRFFFRANRPVRAYAVDPGAYRIAAIEILVTNPQYMTTDGKWVQPPPDTHSTAFTDAVYSKPFTVEAGKRYYLGDFVGTAPPAGLAVALGASAYHNFKETNCEFEKLYAGLARLPIESPLVELKAGEMRK